jgi:protein-L-isoaspartate(D-aspartate) O-methyltransferase
MLELLSLKPEYTVFEIGTGSGYQTALLAELSRHVYSIERHPELAAQAESVLQRLAYANITILIGDGTAGLPALAPFDAIIVSAAAPEFPRTLFEQLREGGRLVVPVGPIDCQQLQLITKQLGSPVMTREIGCRFVPLIGEQGYSSK